MRVLIALVVLAVVAFFGYRMYQNQGTQQAVEQAAQTATQAATQAADAAKQAAGAAQQAAGDAAKAAGDAANQAASLVVGGVDLGGELKGMLDKVSTTLGRSRPGLGRCRQGEPRRVEGQGGRYGCAGRAVAGRGQEGFGGHGQRGVARLEGAGRQGRRGPRRGVHQAGARRDDHQAGGVGAGSSLSGRISRPAVARQTRCRTARRVSLGHTQIVPLRQRAEALLKLQLSTLEQSGWHQQSHGALPMADCGRSPQRDARDEQ